MGKRIPKSKKSDIIDRHLQGFSRDETSRATGASAGAVSNTTQEFIECARSTSLTEALAEFDAKAAVEAFQQVLTFIRENNITDKDLLLASKKAIETGKKQIDDLNGERENLQAQICALKVEQEKLQTTFKNEEKRLEIEKQQKLEAHNVTMEKIEKTAATLKVLEENRVTPEQLGKFGDMLENVRLCGDDPQRFLKLLEREASITVLVLEREKHLENLKNNVAASVKELVRLQKHAKTAKSAVRNWRTVQHLGWTSAGLAKLVNVTQGMGTVEDVLTRLEQFESLEALNAEILKKKNEAETLEQQNMKSIRDTAASLAKTAQTCSDLANKTFPAATTSIVNHLQNNIGVLVKNYTDLTEKYGKLVDYHNALVESCKVNDRWLEHSIYWVTFMQKPAVLPETQMRIVLDTVFTKLEERCLDREAKLNTEFFCYLARKVLCCCVSSLKKFYENPKTASFQDATYASIAISFMLQDIAVPFINWYDQHSSESNVREQFSNLRYWLDELVKDFRRGL
jgi:hypothetical protein